MFTCGLQRDLASRSGLFTEMATFISFPPKNFFRALWHRENENKKDSVELVGARLHSTIRLNASIFRWVTAEKVQRTRDYMKTTSRLITKLTQPAFSLPNLLDSIYRFYSSWKFFRREFHNFFFFALELRFSGISVDVTCILLSERQMELTFFHFLSNVAFGSLWIIFLAFLSRRTHIFLLEFLCNSKIRLKWSLTDEIHYEFAELLP